MLALKNSKIKKKPLKKEEVSLIDKINRAALAT